MKGLLKICIRYMLTAILLTVLVLAGDILIAASSLARMSQNFPMTSMHREDMEKIEQEFSKADQAAKLSETGYQVLEESGCLWAMRLDDSGDVIWEYQLPPQIPRRYTLGDVAAFSRWYLKDYPVFVWHGQTGLMVYGFPQDLARFDFWGNSKIIRHVPEILITLLVLDFLLIASLAVYFGFCFYRTLRPIGCGIELLAAKKEVHLKEQGLAGDLIRQLNQTSALLLAQDAQLKKRDQARTDWISGVSHDVRTPLSLIMGLSDEMSREPSLGESFRQKAAAIRKSSESIGRLIADLNLTIKLEYGSSPLRKQKLYPAGLLRECIADFYNREIPESCSFQIDLIISEDAKKVCIYADRQLLMRVFENLLGNSIRHNSQNGQASVRLFVEGCKLSLLFTDDGPGIPPVVTEILEGVQEPRPEIHIMGLRVVCQIILAHRGEVRFVKRDSGYADVLVRLPIT